MHFEGLLMPENFLCEIHLHDLLDEKMGEYLSPLSLTTSGNETILAGVIHDQAELFGVLWKIRDLGVTLVSLSVINQQPSK